MSDATPFLVSARKYRPQTFADLVAQEHVAETLRNAIRSDRLAHAYLFCGPRGVGKTTAARILAKAVNCEAPLAGRPDVEPCRACRSCVDFEAGRSLNMIEIDAASHNGVDYMRDLRDAIRIPPQGARKKVYVLDEVHMLSSGAFNALLKTLEEPPPHALFIFATTEPHKVLPTILSRTQRFDFRRIAVPDIIQQLQAICADEGFSADDESLLLLARKADGAMRDALSLFDQAIALCGTALTGEALRDALGVVGTDRYFEATDAIAGGDRAALIHLVDLVVRRGHDLREFMLGLAEHLRNLLVVRATDAVELVEGTEADRTRYRAAAQRWAEPDVLHALMLADASIAELKDGPHPRLALELALLKMSSLATAADLQSLLAKLDRLEASIADGGPPPSSAPTTQVAPLDVPERPTYPAAAPKVSEPASGGYGSEEPAEPAHPPRQMPDEPPDDGGLPSAPPPSPPAPPPSAQTPEPPAPTPGAGLFGPPALAPRAGGDGQDGASAFSSAPALATAHAATDAPADSSDDHFGASLAPLRAAWPQIVGAVQEDCGIRVAAILRQGEPTRLHRGAVEIGLADPFACKIATDHHDAILSAARAHAAGEVPALTFVVAARAARETASGADPFEALKKLRQEHPVVRALFDRFGAEIVWN